MEDSMSSASSNLIRYYHPQKGLDNWVIIQAGAGAGKTTELVSRVLSYAIEFKKKNHRYPKIVVTTFTIKATQELKERLIKACFKLEAEISARVASELQEWLLSSQVIITTIHSAVLRFLREQGSEIGLKSDFEVIENPKPIISEFLKKSYFQSPEIQNLILPIYQYFNFYELVDILHSCFNQYLVFGSLSFYKAASDIDLWKQQVHSYQELLKSNLSSIDFRSLRTTPQKKAYENYKKLVSASFQSQVDLVQFFSKHNLTGRNTFGRGEDDEQMVELLKKIKGLATPEWNHEKLFESQRVSQMVCELTESLFPKWIQFILDKQQIPLSNIESWGLYLARSYPETASNFSEQWDYWYVDEYQDTSPIQVAILEFLMGQKRGFFVGDPQQSIYLFRGSRPHVFEERIKFIESKKGEVLFLTTNYRTVPNVLDFINQFTSQMKSQKFVQMQVGKDLKLSGKVRLQKTECENEIAVESWVGQVCVSHIKQLINEKENLNLSDVAILVPRSKELFWIAQALQAAGIPFQLHSGGDFFSRREILDVIFVLRFILLPEDDTNLLGILRSEFSDLHTQDLFSYKKTDSACLWQHIRGLYQHSKIVQSLQKIQDLKSQKGIFWSWLQALDILNIIKINQIQDPSGIAEANIWKLILDIYELQSNSNFDWYQVYWDLLDRIESSQNEKDAVSDAESNRVQMMTIHASKGLEFKHLILPYFDRRKKIDNEYRFLIDEFNRQFIARNEHGFPPQAKNYQEQISKLEDEELDRVWYVGLTRAIESLFIPYLDKLDEKEKSPMVTLLNQFDAELNDDIKIEHQQNLNDVHTKKIQFSLEENIKCSPASWGESIFINWDLFQRQTEGIHLHAKLEKIVLSQLELAEFREFYWIKTKFSKWYNRIKNGYPEWGYTIIDKSQILTRRIDIWGRDEITQKVWILDYKSGASVDIEKAWLQLEGYAKDLIRLGLISSTNQIEIAIAMLREQTILEREF